MYITKIHRQHLHRRPSHTRQIRRDHRMGARRPHTQNPAPDAHTPDNSIISWNDQGLRCAAQAGQTGEAVGPSRNVVACFTRQRPIRRDGDRNAPRENHPRYRGAHPALPMTPNQGSHRRVSTDAAPTQVRRGDAATREAFAVRGRDLHEFIWNAGIARSKGKSTADDTEPQVTPCGPRACGAPAGGHICGSQDCGPRACGAPAADGFPLERGGLAAHPVCERDRCVAATRGAGVSLVEGASDDSLGRLHQGRRPASQGQQRALSQ